MPVRDLQKGEEVFLFEKPKAKTAAPVQEELPSSFFEQSLRVGAMARPEFFPDIPAETTALQKGIAEIGTQSALPTILSAAGALVPPPFTPFGIAGGSFAGEAINQATGISPRSNLQLGLSAALPFVPSILRRGTAFPRAFGSSTRSAIKLNELAPKEAERVIKKLAPMQGFRTLFQQAAQEGGQVPMIRTLSALDDLIGQMERVSTPPNVLKNLMSLKTKITSAGGNLSPIDVQAELEIFGKSIKALERAEGSPFGAAKKVFSSMIDDLDNISASTPGAASLILAREIFKRSKSLDNIVEEISKATNIIKGQGDFVSFNAAQVIRNLKKDRFFSQAFNPDEQKEVFSLFKKLNRIPALPPGAGQQFGSGRALLEIRKIALFGLSGAGVGSLLGVDPQIAGALGLGFYGAEKMILNPINNMVIALSMKEGRILLKRLIKEGSITENGLGILASWVRSRIAENGTARKGPIRENLPVMLP